MRILITGSREWSDRFTVWAALDDLLAEARKAPGLGPFLTVVHGDARGADYWAKTWAIGHAPLVANEPHKADWKTTGKAAGIWRNRHMVNLGADLCLAFFQPGAANRGTADCVRRAEEAGIPVRRYPEEPTAAEWAAHADEDEVPALRARLDEIWGQQ